MAITVRLAERDELERVNELRKMVNDLHVAGKPDVFRTGFCEELKQYLYHHYEAESTDVLVAVMDGEICGFAVVTHVAKPGNPMKNALKYCEVEEFGVDESARRKGVATALIEYIKEDASKRGYHKLELNMWEFNTGALAFYEAVGFKTYRRYMEMEL